MEANPVLSSADNTEHGARTIVPAAAGVDAFAQAVARHREATPRRRAVLASLSGIDGSGKGYLAARIAQRLAGAGFAVALINIDGWLNLPAVRFNDRNPAEHFYRYALRFDELFARLLLPLTASRSIRIEADVTEETATSYRKHVYEYEDVDVVLVEGIYLLKRELRSHYDLSAWIECSFATALARAVARAQEGLPPEATVQAYRRVYFPAQEVHFALDHPQEAATMRLDNDSKA